MSEEINNANPIPSAAPESFAAVNPIFIEAQAVEAIRTCFDPEIPVNIYELGLIYLIQVSVQGDVQIQMTLTSPSCPSAGTIPPEVEHKVRNVPGVKSVRVDLVWDPPWSPNNMSEAAKLQLGFA